ncbi:MAG: aromatic amino acid aminotransferase [Chloroflexi bacterium]|nr:aromatic amino acid aminotransferase [Chloroflexota bacterium]|tara:strand:- start:6 stop:1199 length:1194 start_codon:yes stop_codon:yes gene_type:complete
MIFNNISEAEKDPILGLTEEFKNDLNSKKVNLSVGVYQDDKGNTPTLPSVTEAEKEILNQNISKTYKPIDGDKEFTEKSIQLVAGEDLFSEINNTSFGLNTPGGTGALRLASDFLFQFSSKSKVWISNPSWPNHKPIFEASGFKVDIYPYFNNESNSIDFESLTSTIKKIPKGDVLVMHGCCHNPTGEDLKAEHWDEVSDIAKSNNLLVICDFAYQGLADGLDDDANGVRKMIRNLDNLIICTSYSKNFGLYSERVGCLIYNSKNESNCAPVLSHMKKTARSNYSNPPAHGSEIVKFILSHNSLRDKWKEDLNNMRDRIKNMRKLLVKELKNKGCSKDFSFIERQKGMFSYTGLSKDQVNALKKNNSIYIVNSGRINIAGLTTTNVEYVANAIKDVI